MFRGFGKNNESVNIKNKNKTQALTAKNKKQKTMQKQQENKQNIKAKHKSARGMHRQWHTNIQGKRDSLTEIKSEGLRVTKI